MNLAVDSMSQQNDVIQEQEFVLQTRIPDIGLGPINWIKCGL